MSDSKSFENFLLLLGKKVKMRGWPGFSGGLDTKKDGTGEYSVYRTWNSVQLMFHVSTLLPFSRTNKQQVNIPQPKV